MQLQNNINFILYLARYFNDTFLHFTFKFCPTVF